MITRGQKARPGARRRVEHKRHRLFDVVILPILAMITLFLIYEAITH